jgi:hypothetical protein
MRSTKDAPDQTAAVEKSVLQQGDQYEVFLTLSRFRGDCYDCLPGRGDALFELTDALLRRLALTGCGGRMPGFRCRRRRSAAWSWRTTFRLGCGRTLPLARTAPSATPTAGVMPSTR